MRCRKRTTWLIAAILAATSMGCLQQRTSALIDLSDQLVANAKGVLRSLKSVKDKKSAEAALPVLTEKFPLIFSMVRDLQERGAAGDKAGGFTKSGLDTVKERMSSFQGVMQEIAAENKRIELIRGLPAEFWNVMRTESFKGLTILIETDASQFPPELVRYAKSAGALVSEYGADHVVLVECPGTSPAQLEEIANQLQTKLGGSTTVARIGAGGEASMIVGPVDDFEKFVSQIDFGKVTDKDPAQRAVYVDTSERRSAFNGRRRSAKISSASYEWNRPRPELRDDEYKVMVGKIGKDRVVRFIVANDAENPDLVNYILSALPTGEPKAGSYDILTATGHIGPVDDFNAFCNALDFAKIESRDDAERTITITVDGPKVKAKADEAYQKRRAEEIRKDMEEQQARLNRPNRLAGPAGPPAPTNGLGGPVGPEAPGGGASGPGAFPGRRFGPGMDLPDASEPDYYKKLADLMTDKTNFLNGKAIDALLKINPQDIPDKAVRQQIARNFRDLATGNITSMGNGKAIRGLALYGGKFSVPILVELLDKEQLKVDNSLFEALAANPDPRGAEAVCRKLGHSFNNAAAISALRQMGPVAEDALQKAAPSTDEAVSLAAVKLLGEVGTPKSFGLLTKASKTGTEEVRLAAKESIKEIRERARKPAKAATE